MKIYDLKANYQENPIGISLDGLMLTWKVKEAKGKYQEKVHIRIGTDVLTDGSLHNCCFDSGQMELRECMYAPEFSMEAGCTYYWQVSITDDAGDKSDSPIATFEGGHPEEAWQGKWIAAPFTPELHPLFQKTFVLEEEDLVDVRARLYICGLGLYEVFINGEKAGEEYLTPYYTDYRYWIQYQTLDVAHLLKCGENRIDVYMGKGWYMGKFCYSAKAEFHNYYGSQMKLLADLYLWSKNGNKTIIGTDTDWLALKSPVAISGIYEGEMYDARMDRNVIQIPERQRLYAVETIKPEAPLYPMMGVGVKKQQVLKVKEIITTGFGETVLDFGQIITGWVAFRDNAPKGKKIILQYGEAMQDNDLYRDNLRLAKAEFVYLASGEGGLARPHFTYYGFRYVKVKGIEVTAANVDDFEAWVLYSDMQETGFIETSYDKLNRLIENTKWSQKDNFLDIPTDCPQRDERMGWTGDAQIFSAAASFHMQTPTFFRKYLKDMGYEQGEKKGAVPYVVPDILTLARLKNGEPEHDMTKPNWGEAGSSVWGDAATIIPWNMYLFYGNKKLLKEQYDNMKQWTDFIIYMDETHSNGKRLWDCGFHFGDWLALDGEEGQKTGGTDCYYVSSIYYMYSAQLTAKAARVLGKQEEAEYYTLIAQEVRAAVRKKYVIAPGQLSVTTQTAYVCGIHFNIFEEDELEEAGRQLKTLLEKYNHHLSTGFTGTAYLCQALSKVGMVEEAYTLLLNEDYPSWLYEVNLGATTIWERWNSILPNGRIQDTGMNSLNHYAYGAIVEWIYRSACGLNPVEDAPGFAGIKFAPQADRRLKFVEAKYDSLYGLYEAGWKWQGDKVIYRLTVPFGAEAQFHPQKGLRVEKINGKSVEDLQDGELLKLVAGSYEIEGQLL